MSIIFRKIIMHLNKKILTSVSQNSPAVRELLKGLGLFSKVQPERILLGLDVTMKPYASAIRKS